jgi:exocyst complex component 1
MPQPAPSFTRMERAPTPPNGALLVPSTIRRPYANGRAESSQSRPSDLRGPPPVPPVPTPSAPPQFTGRPSPRPRRAASPPVMRPESFDAGAMAYIAAEMPERAATPPRPRPTTPSSSSQSQVPPPPSLPASLRPGRGRRPSNASSSTRSFASGITSVSAQVPFSTLSGSPDRSSVATPPPISAATPPSIPSSLSVAAGSKRQNGSTLPVANGSAEPSTNGSAIPMPNSAAYPATNGFSLHVATASTSSYSPSVVTTIVPEPSLETPRPHNLSASPSARTRKLSSGTNEPASQATQGRREPNTRVSFFDPANQAVLDRLLSGDIAFRDDWDEDAGEEIEVAEETTQAMLSSVEEMLEGYEWASGDILAGTARGTTDLIEARLLDELTALDKVGLKSTVLTRILTTSTCRPIFIPSLSPMTVSISCSSILMNH